MRKNKFLLKFMLLIIIMTITFAGFPALTAADDLIILHTNDIHGRIEVGEGMLGMSGISSLISAHREDYEHVLVLDAGDTIHGRPITNLLEGESTVLAMNKAGYDVMVPGNHDFNFGYERLLELEEIMEFDLVAANVEKEGVLLFDPYVIKELGQFKIGVIGLATPATVTTTHPKNVVGLEFTDMIEAAEKYVGFLQEENVDLIIVLGHVGMDGNYPSTEVAEQVDGIDLFVDGHSHDKLTEGIWHSDTLFAQAHEYGKYLGRVRVNFVNAAPQLAADLIPADIEGLAVDESMERLMEEWRTEARNIMLGN